MRSGMSFESQNTITSQL
jgi:hypothetical protein